MSKCRELFDLSADLLSVPEETTQEKMLRMTGIDVTECPRYKHGCMRHIGKLPRLSLGTIEVASRVSCEKPLNQTRRRAA